MLQSAATRRRLAAITIVMCCAAGCDIDLGRSAPTASSTISTVPSTAAQEWVAGTAALAMYLRWETTAEGLVGVAKVTTRTDAGDVSSQTEELTGVANGSQVVLTLAGQTWTGTISGDNLVLSRPERDGSRAELTLQRATASEFDAAVAALAGTTTTVAPRVPASTTTVPSATSTTSVPATTVDVDTARRVEIETATARLRAIDGAQTVNDVGVALEQLYIADSSFWDWVGSCTGAAPTFVDLQAAATAVRGRLETLDAVISDLTATRQQVYELAVGAVPGTADAAVDDAANALDHADYLIDGYTTYGAEVRHAADTIVTSARTARDQVC